MDKKTVAKKLFDLLDNQYQFAVRAVNEGTRDLESAYAANKAHEDEWRKDDYGIGGFGSQHRAPYSEAYISARKVEIANEQKRLTDFKEMRDFYTNEIFNKVMG